MLTIRKAQLEAFQRDLNRREALPAVRARLCALGLLREGDISADEQILREIERAQSLGLFNQSAMVQLASYGFHFPGWHSRAAAQEALRRADLSGEECLALLHRVLSGP